MTVYIYIYESVSTRAFDRSIFDQIARFRMNDATNNTENDTPIEYTDKHMPVYQTSIAVNLAIAITAIFIVFNGPRVSC
jgi:hypothetical protein